MFILCVNWGRINCRSVTWVSLKTQSSHAILLWTVYKKTWLVTLKERIRLNAIKIVNYVKEIWNIITENCQNEWIVSVNLVSTTVFIERKAYARPTSDLSLYVWRNSRAGSVAVSAFILKQILIFGGFWSVKDKRHQYYFKVRHLY